jgi:hypothetical protein
MIRAGGQRRTPRTVVDTLNSHIGKLLAPPGRLKHYQERGQLCSPARLTQGAAGGVRKKWARVIKERGHGIGVSQK